MILNKICRSIVRRTLRFCGQHRILSPRRTAILLYRLQLGRWPAIDNPEDFNEKILWLEFNTDTSRWSELADKYSVRRFVASKGLGHILVPLYGVWDNAADIDFDSLPESFVLKATNGYASTILVSDKKNTDLVRLRNSVKSWPTTIFGLAGAEPHYTRITPRIMAEKLLAGDIDPDTGRKRLPPDYKFLCFDGRPVYCLVCTDRNFDTFYAPAIYYTLPDWKVIEDSVTPETKPKNQIPKPRELDKMMEYASTLSEGFPFVRVDLYNIDDNIYFGELTFTPNAGRCNTVPPEFCRHLGTLLHLPFGKEQDF